MPPEGSRLPGWGPGHRHCLPHRPLLSAEYQGVDPRAGGVARSRGPGLPAHLSPPARWTCCAASATAAEVTGAAEACVNCARSAKRCPRNCAASPARSGREGGGIYSAREVGYIALQCPDHEHYHAQSENLLVEILTNRVPPADPGKRGGCGHHAAQFRDAPDPLRHRRLCAGRRALARAAEGCRCWIASWAGCATCSCCQRRAPLAADRIGRCAPPRAHSAAAGCTGGAGRDRGQARRGAPAHARGGRGGGRAHWRGAAPSVQDCSPLPGRSSARTHRKFEEFVCELPA